MPTAVPQARALRGNVPLRRNSQKRSPAQVVEAPDEGNEEVHVLEGKGASDDKLEAGYQDAVAMMTVARQRRAEVNKAQLDKLKQKLPCARRGNWAIGKTIIIARPK